LINPARIRGGLADTSLSGCAQPWIDLGVALLERRRHGDRANWMAAVSALPEIPGTVVDLSASAIEVTTESRIDPQTKEQIAHSLMALHPWRKGPFNICGVAIDSEWRSDLKWARIAGSLSSLSGRLVLDVGCGNGYYLLRMIGSGAKVAVGIDPTQLFLAQFAAINHYVETDRAFILPMKSDELTVEMVAPSARFDTVFSMGVYYHRRNPLDHLAELYAFLREGGELVLETLVVEGDEDRELNPVSRYAQMRNVWSLPSVARLRRLLQQSGFVDISLIDLTVTTIEEQRSTPWMTFDSLARFLDPDDASRTIEGYPAPLRACITAQRA